MPPRAPNLRLLVWDLSTSPYVDIAGARLFGETQRALAVQGVTMRIVEARAQARDLIRKEVGMSVGEVSRRISIDDAIAGAAGSVDRSSIGPDSVTHHRGPEP